MRWHNMGNSLVVCKVDSPDIISYLNVYEEGDEWVKIQGCEVCSLENRKKCCNGCPMFSEKGCYFHLELTNSKPFRCVVKPSPDTCLSWCSLEFECIAGSKKGKIRRVKDIGNVFI